MVTIDNSYPKGSLKKDIQSELGHCPNWVGVTQTNLISVPNKLTETCNKYLRYFLILEMCPILLPIGRESRVSEELRQCLNFH